MGQLHKNTYTRRNDLEGVDSNLLVIDLECKTRIINVYRNFNPQGGVSARDKFNYQLGIILLAINKETVILGDFNLDYLTEPNLYHLTYIT